MKHSSLISLAAALIGMSGCVAYPVDNYRESRDHGTQRDRGRDQYRDQRDSNHGDERDRRPDCDPRMADCFRH
jgi:hypothetical protein